MTSSLVCVVLMILVSTSGVCPSHIDCEPCLCSASADGSITADCTRKLNTSGIPLIPKIRCNVTTLLVAHNDLKHMKAHFLLGFVNLRHLDISKNSIANLDTDSFVDVEKLTHLILYGNRLLLSNSSYPPGLFRYQSSLVSLDISDNDDLSNPTSSYPDETFGDLVALETLSIDGLPNAIFGPGFRHLRNLTHLSINGSRGYCQIESMQNNTFTNLASVKYLDVSKCGILKVEMKSFEPLRNIEFLIVSHNQGLGFDSLGAVIYGLRNSSLQVLDATEIVPSFAVGVQLKYKHVKHLRHVPLKKLYLDSNRLELIEDTALTCLTHLESVSVEDNKLTFGTYLLSGDPMIHLTNVAAANQYQSDNLPPIVQGESLQGSNPTSRIYKRTLGKSIFHSLLSDDILSYKIKLSLPPTLYCLNVTNSVLGYDIPKIDFYENKLSIIDGSSNMLTKWIGPISSMDHLNYLDLSNNHCNNISKDFLLHAFNLRTLNLSRNMLSASLSVDNGEIFKNLTHLKVLRLDRNIIETIPEYIFRDLENLRYLDLSWNLMTTWGFRIKHMTKLNHLDISYNRFQRIPEDLMQQIDKLKGQSRNYSKFHINIKGNTLTCDCNTLDSLQWMLSDHVAVKHLNETLCELENSTKINLGHLDELLTNLKFKCNVVLPIILTTSAGIFLGIVSIIGGIAYRYRWRLRYLYYTTRRRYRGYQRLTEEQSYTYDAFVSYADEDRCFVTEDMRHTLEDRYGLRLCIHHRDFMVGEAITANILNAIQSSRKTIVILSPNFIRSSWCDYEVQMAKMEQIHAGRDVLCIVWYENIPNKNDISDDIDDELCTGTYLDFRNIGADNDEFWERLREAIAV